MADNVQWIRLKVGMFDGSSFKKIKRAKIGGVNYRDKLTAIWFELLDLAGKSNANGYLVDNNEIPYQSFEDIATMLDRETEEIELCMSFYIKEKMVEIIDDIYCLTNFMQYQNKDGLERIREQNRERQARFRERKKDLLLEQRNDNDKVTLRNGIPLNSISNSNNIDNTNIDIIEIDKINEYFDKTYSIYPRKVSKLQAKSTYEHKLRGLTKEVAKDKANKIYIHLKKQIECWSKENDGVGRKIEHVPYFSSWLNSEIEDSPKYKRSKK